MPAILTPESVVGWSSDQIAAPVGGEVVIMSIERGSYYGLEDVAGDIWNRLEKPVQVRALCEALAEKYEAESPDIERDVLKFLNELVEEGLVSVT